MSFGPNDLQPCGTAGARVRHAAHGQLCSVCEPLLERPGWCPLCADPVTVLGDVVCGHDQEGVPGFLCPGSGAELPPIVPGLVRIGYAPRRLQVLGGAA